MKIIFNFILCNLFSAEAEKFLKYFDFIFCPLKHGKTACATKKQSAEKHSTEKHTAHKHSAEKHTAKKQLRKISIQQKSIHQKSIQHKSRWVKKAAAFQNQFPLQIFIFKNNLNDL